MAQLTTSPANMTPRSMRRPNFFLVGAPRCGTTALFRWIRRHERVFMPVEKECHYFSDDMPNLQQVTTEGEYLSHFVAAADRHLAVGEASVMYLFSSTAIDHLLAFAPDAHLIVTLRNPIDLVPSWHGQLIATFEEEIESFEQAWRLQDTRASGRQIPHSCRTPQLLQYASVARLGEQVERLLGKIDRNQIHFVVYDDLKNAPQRTYLSVLEAIGVPSDQFDSFSVVNANARTLSPKFAELWLRNPTIGSFRRTVRRAVGESVYGWARDAIVPRLARPIAKPVMSDELRQELVETFQEDVSLLSSLVARDFAHWLK